MHIAVAGPDVLISLMAAIGIEKSEPPRTLHSTLSNAQTSHRCGKARGVVWCMAVLVCLKGLYSKSVPPNLADLPNEFKH